MITHPGTVAAPRRPRKRSVLGYDRWYNGYWPGYLLSVLILLFTAAYLCVEAARVFTGTLNRNPLYSYGLYPGNTYFPPYFSPTNSFNVERQHQTVWPWSSPAFLFSILFLLTALFALTAARRATYSMFYLFYTFSILSLLVLPFLIAYYSTDIHRLNAGQIAWTTYAPANRERSLSIVMLVLSVVMLPLFSLSLLCSACGFDCCRHKGGVFYTPILPGQTNATYPHPATTNM